MKDKDDDGNKNSDNTGEKKEDNPVEMKIKLAFPISPIPEMIQKTLSIDDKEFEQRIFAWFRTTVRQLGSTQSMEWLMTDMASTAKLLIAWLDTPQIISFGNQEEEEHSDDEKESFPEMLYKYGFRLDGPVQIASLLPANEELRKELEGKKIEERQRTREKIQNDHVNEMVADTITKLGLNPGNPEHVKIAIRHVHVVMEKAKEVFVEGQGNAIVDTRQVI